MSYTNQLVEYVLDTQYGDIPEEALKACKRLLLDCTGSALAEVNEPAGNIIYQYVSSIKTNGSCRLIGSGLKTSLDNAAFANGILSHAISFDDSGPSHPSVTVVPPLYALGENYHLNGKKILTAQVLGYEVFQKLNLVTKEAWEMRDRGWHPTGFFGAVTSSLIAAKLMGLNLDQALNAMGIAASMGGGLSQNIGNMTMSLHAGNASRNGIIAAMLAQKGFSGDKDIIEGRFGLMNALAGEGNYEIENMVKTLGNPYGVLKPGINIKPYPNCWAHHRVYDAMLFLVKTHDIKPEDVEYIECDLQPGKPTYRYLEPKTDFEAKYSLGYGIAMSLLDRKLQIEQYALERITDPDVKEIMSLIKHVPQTDIGKKHTVTIKLRDGNVYAKMVEHSKGHAIFDPLTDEELVEKYVICAQRVLPKEKVKKSIQLIEEMQELDDVARLMDAVTVD